ncbi:MAG: AbrB/MazE/SpoVT family DNA-binding domain-containing protein [Chloroflexi bacterium]|nr:AbrB/MazE/SpoVT family DNA-binding domain-containing protein [Chloroflexota bacterium]
MSPKHQVTIPVDVLARAGLQAGDELRVENLDSGDIVLRRALSAIERYAGTMPGVWPLGALEELRSEWD